MRKNWFSLGKLWFQFLFFSCKKLHNLSNRLDFEIAICYNIKWKFIIITT